MKDLETENLKIRKFKIADTEDAHKYLGTEKKLADCLNYNPHKSIEETRAIIASYIKEYEMNELVWAMEEKKTHKVIGFINAQEVSKTNRGCRIKFGIALNWVNTGYMEEALKVVFEYLIKEEKYHIIISNFYDCNKELTQIKEKILQSVGMKKEACLRDRRINQKTGKFESKIIYSITENEIQED